MKVALIVGHNSQSKGAYSKIVGSEFDYWKRISEKIKGEIPNLVDIYERKKQKTYGAEMREMLNELNKKEYKYCLELHFNSSNTEKAKGCECLVYCKNEKAKELATKFMARLQNSFSSTLRGNRGIVPVKNSEERGGYGICKSKWTYLLLEPFFGSNFDEALRFSIESDVVRLLIDFIKEN